MRQSQPITNNSLHSSSLERASGTRTPWRRGRGRKVRPPENTIPRQVGRAAPGVTPRPRRHQVTIQTFELYRQNSIYLQNVII